jgi:hypothetical protein
MGSIYDYYSTTVYGAQLDTYNAPTVGVPADYLISYASISYNAEGTIATVIVTPPSGSVGSYGGSVAGSGSFNDPDFIINSNSNTFTIGSLISPLVPGTNYYMRLRAYSGAGSTGTVGDYYYASVVPPKPTYNGSYTSTTSSTQTPPMSALDQLNNLSNSLDGSGSQSNAVSSGTSYAVQENREVSTSLFKITNNNSSKNKYSLVTKNTEISTAYNHYAFGTSMFFQSNINDVRGSGGIGFFTSNNGMTGYFVLIQTTANLSDSADKEVKIIKVVNGKQTVLTDSQQNSSTKTLTGILGGISYKVDVNVVTSGSTRAIDVYVNNFKITAVDSTAILPVTKNVSMLAATGKANFDYFYATPLTEDQYKNGIIQNVYIGKYGTKTLSFLYGDKVLGSESISSVQLPFLEEFGTVARELRKINIKYESRPGNPLYTSTGINKFVSVLGERLTSFGAEVYVINNSGTFVPLDDSNLYSFSIVGNYIVTTGQHEYVSNTLSENTVAEPVIFESSWIQSEADAKSLTTWIQTQWSKQQQVVNLETFGNPLISIGDVITINHPSNDFDGTEKFVVTQVSNSFKEGLQTSITARSIYS